MGEGFAFLKRQFYIKATRRESYSSNTEGSKPFRYMKRPYGEDVMVKPR
jgi:hypothetical protein